MNRILIITGILISTVIAADDTYNFNFNAAVEKCIIDGTLDGTVKFYLAGAKIDGQIIQKGIVANKKTNAFGKSPEFSCDWVLRSALISLQAAAKKCGANAVINIISYYKAKPCSSNTTYECHKGNAISGLALKGDLAIITEKSNLPNMQRNISKYETLSDAEVIQLWQKVKSNSTFTSLIPKDTFNLKLTFNYDVLNCDSLFQWRLEAKKDSLGVKINLKNTEKNKNLVRNIALKNETSITTSTKFIGVIKQNGLEMIVFETM